VDRHILTRRPSIALATVVCGLGAWQAASALALDDEKPGPGCAGPAFTDKTGDQADSTPLLGAASTAGPNEDITGGFLRYDGDTITANIKIANLTNAVPSDATNVEYYFQYTIAGANHYVSASSDGTTTTYSYGTFDPNTGYSATGTVPGKEFPGPDGVIQMQLPPTDVQQGATLGDPYAVAAQGLEIPGVGGLVSPADTAPDDMKGAPFVIGSCMDGGSSATPAPAPAAGTSGSSASLVFRAPTILGSAKTANRTHKLSFKIDAQQKVTGLLVRLLPVSGKGKALASERVASASGLTKIKLRVSARVKAGSYLLVATGTVDGKKLRGTQRVRLKS
jgi:hypothetical protein